MLRFTLAIFAAGILVGCNKPAEKAETPAAPPPAAPVAPAAALNPAPHQSLLEKMTTRLVDKQVALAENPHLVSLKKNELGELNPITYASKAYFSAVSQATVANLQHNIDIMKAANDDKWPSFEAFDTLLKQSGVKLQGLYRWQVYAYDSKDGSISILEDREMKRAEYEKAGLEYPEDEPQP